MPTGIVYNNSNVSLSTAYCTSNLDTHYLSASNNQSEGILGFHPNIICQIYHAPCHSVDACPSRYEPRQQPVLLACAAFNSVDTREQLWYPNSTAASQMTLYDDKLLSKSVYSRNESCEGWEWNFVAYQKH